jgi:hypothetical protein
MRHGFRHCGGVYAGENKDDAGSGHSLVSGRADWLKKISICVEWGFFFPQLVTVQVN